MKRTDALKGLSHQHHQGLFAALKLKRAQPATALEARAAFLDFFEREGAGHFRAEEDLLLPAFARHTQPDDALIVRVLTDHVDLRRRALDLEADTDPAPAVLHELGERLESHIRFEERILFPKLEQTLRSSSSSGSASRWRATSPTPILPAHITQPENRPCSALRCTCSGLAPGRRAPRPRRR